MNEIVHGCGEHLTVEDGVSVQCTRCGQDVLFDSTLPASRLVARGIVRWPGMRPSRLAGASTAVASPPPGMIDVIDVEVFDNVVRLYAELLDRYLSAFRYRLLLEGIPEDQVGVEVEKMRDRWEL